MVVKDQIPVGAHMTAAERNVRPAVSVFPQEAPDAPRQGAVRSRPPQIPVVTFSYDQEAWITGDLIAPNLVHDPTASVVRGKQNPEVLRQNINVRNHVAYGSLFTYDPYVYGVR
jgi:hypothetical protein